MNTQIWSIFRQEEKNFEAKHNYIFTQEYIHKVFLEYKE